VANQYDPCLQLKAASLMIPRTTCEESQSIMLRCWHVTLPVIEASGFYQTLAQELCCLLGDA
jgi:hypothetical protein